MQIGTVKAPLRGNHQEPAKDTFVAHVHAQRDLWLAPVAAEVTLPDKQPEQVPPFEVIQGVSHASMVGDAVSPSSFPCNESSDEPGAIGPAQHSQSSQPGACVNGGIVRPMVESMPVRQPPMRT